VNTSTGSHVHGSTITLLNEKISTHEVVRIFRNYLCFFCVPGTNNRPKEKQSRKTTKRRKQIGTKNMKLLYLHISPFTVCSQENILWKAGHRLCVPKQTIRRHSADRISPQSVTQNKVTHCAARRCCATGVQISPTHTDPTTLVGGVSSFPSPPSSFSHSPG
jgi:hypothetical protein